MITSSKSAFKKRLRRRGALVMGNAWERLLCPHDWRRRGGHEVQVSAVEDCDRVIQNAAGIHRERGVTTTERGNSERLLLEHEPDHTARNTPTRRHGFDLNGQRERDQFLFLERGVRYKDDFGAARATDSVSAAELAVVRLASPL